MPVVVVETQSEQMRLLCIFFWHDKNLASKRRGFKLVFAFVGKVVRPRFLFDPIYDEVGKGVVLGDREPF